MVKHYKNFNIKKKHKGSIILIGNFDGLHLGHQKLFQLAKSYKKKYNLKIGVVNFDPMPKMFFNKKLKNFRLSNIDQKIKLLSNLKVDFVITKKFDKKFSKIKALKFISQILNKKLSSKFIFVSNNFRFGNKREGDVNLLKKYEKLFNYNVIKPEPLIKNKKILAIGNNLNTDIRGANLLNYDSLLISNGIHKDEIKKKGIMYVAKEYEVIINFIQTELKW